MLVRFVILLVLGVGLHNKEGGASTKYTTFPEIYKHYPSMLPNDYNSFNAWSTKCHKLG